MPPGTSRPRSSGLDASRCATRDSARSRDGPRDRRALRARRARAHANEPSVNIIGPSLLGFHDHANVESLRRMFDALGVEINASCRSARRPTTCARSAARGSTCRPRTNSRCRRSNSARALRHAVRRRRCPTAKPARRASARALRAAARFRATGSRTPHADAKLLWYARTVDAHALSGKRVGVFGTPTAAAGIARVLRDELDMHVEFVGTYVLDVRRLAARARRRHHRRTCSSPTTTARSRARSTHAARHHVRLADGTALGEPLRRAVRGRLAAGAHLELSARLRAVHRLRRRQPHRRPRQPDAGARPRTPPDRDVRTARPRPLRRSRARTRTDEPSPSPTAAVAVARRRSAWDRRGRETACGASRSSCARKRAPTSRSTRANAGSRVDRRSRDGAREHVGG
jgi:hypothetical protein